MRFATFVWCWSGVGGRLRLCRVRLQNAQAATMLETALDPPIDLAKRCSAVQRNLDRSPVGSWWRRAKSSGSASQIGKVQYQQRNSCRWAALLRRRWSNFECMRISKPSRNSGQRATSRSSRTPRNVGDPSRSYRWRCDAVSLVVRSEHFKSFGQYRRLQSISCTFRLRQCTSGTRLTLGTRDWTAEFNPKQSLVV
jgi:hypothetical protein